MLFRSDAMIEVGDEAGNRTFEVDVVLPEGIVGVDEQGLVGGTAKRLRWVLVCAFDRGGHGSIIEARVRLQLRRWGWNATVGGCLTRLGCDRLKTMVKKDVALLDGVSLRRVRPTHDRKASADVGYRVWNPFEAELRVDVGGRFDDLQTASRVFRMRLSDNRRER